MNIVDFSMADIESIKKSLNIKYKALLIDCLLGLVYLYLFYFNLTKNIFNTFDEYILSNILLFFLFIVSIFITYQFVTIILDMRLRLSQVLIIKNYCVEECLFKNNNELQSGIILTLYSSYPIYNQMMYKKVKYYITNTDLIKNLNMKKTSLVINTYDVNTFLENPYKIYKI